MVDFRAAKNRDSKKTAHRQMQGINKLGRLSLWYGKGKVQLRGQLEIGDYKDPDSVIYNVTLLNPKEPSKFVFYGFISVPDPANRKVNGKPPSKYVPEERIGSLYFYDGDNNTQFALIYMDSGIKYKSDLYENDGSNSRAPILSGPIYTLHDKESTESREKQSTDRKIVRASSQSNANEIIEDIASLTNDQRQGLFAMLQRLWPSDFGISVLSNQEDEEEEIEYVDEEEDEEEVEVVKPRSRVVEAAKTKDQPETEKVRSLNVRMNRIGSLLVDVSEDVDDDLPF